MRKETVALASDVDGTLLFYRSDKFTDKPGRQETYWRETDLEAISAWQAGGGLFGLCSGRPPMGLFHLLPDKISPDFYIACSGAAVFDRNRDVICEAVIEKEDVRELLGRYGPSVLFAAFHTDSPDALYRSRNTGRMGVKEVLVTSPEDLGDRKLYSLSLIFDHEREAEEACRQINESCPALEAFQNKNSADVVRKGCSKGRGILLVKQKMGVEVMAAIGDSFNDLPMLEAASPSFTFHGSPEKIRSRVTQVVDSVAEALGWLSDSLCL